MIKRDFKDYYRFNQFVSVLTIVSFLCFLLGITLPIFRNTKFFFFTEDISLIKSVQILISEGDFFLAVIIVLFTIITPLIKYIIIAVVIRSTQKSSAKIKFVKFLSKIGKWSMLDVFIIALVIITMKIDGGLFEVHIKNGTIFFAISVILSAIITTLLMKDLEKSDILVP